MWHSGANTCKQFLGLRPRRGFFGAKRMGLQASSQIAENNKTVYDFFVIKMLHVAFRSKHMQTFLGLRPRRGFFGAKRMGLQASSRTAENNKTVYDFFVIKMSNVAFWSKPLQTISGTPTPTGFLPGRQNGIASEFPNRRK